ncbi:hypothetical protein Fot_32608 [Forsythia ovata]|uniref:Ferritin n=1 Tax=Forsythia ovata TaxID=205694 RepID=A0ABD1T8H8_9LAMI
MEVAKAKEDLEAFEKAKGDAEAVSTSMLLEKNLEWQLENAEANFTANFHNTKAYANFSNYFASVGQQEVLAALRLEHLELDFASLEVRFSLLDVKDEDEESNPLV